MKYNIDRNTFGADKRIVENDEAFAGLCLQCHAQEKSGRTTIADQIHRSVKGWGPNKEHAFPCSKCHQPHNSGLPRLMQTNCFEEGPAGLRENSGLSWLPKKKSGDSLQETKAKSATQGEAASSNKKTGTIEVVGCHVRQFGRGGSPQGQQNGSQWNQKTTW